MHWDAIERAVNATCKADAALLAIFASAMRLSGSGDHAVPMLEWLVIADAQEEQWAPCTVQFDLWHFDRATLVAAERRIRRLFVPELQFQMAGVTCLSEYLDGETLASPDRDGYFGRAIRIRFTPLRDRYANATG